MKSEDFSPLCARRGKVTRRSAPVKGNKVEEGPGDKPERRRETKTAAERKDGEGQDGGKEKKMDGKLPFSGY